MKKAASVALQPRIEEAIENANAAVDVQFSTRRATILHLLSIIVNKHSFRSSDSANRVRAKYHKMFPDSSFTAINCGRTKANYLTIHALAPFAGEQFKIQFGAQKFGLHLDNNNKTRIEFWIVYFLDGNRKCRRPGVGEVI